MTAGAPARFRPAAPPVRTRPIEELPEIGRAMVLTFDDGPDPLYTPHILATLREHDVRAMFFLCGEMANDNQDLVRAIAEDGHTIGNHSWTHPLVTRLSRAGARDELGPTSEVIEKITGAAPLWYRAPHGAWNRNSFEIGAAMGMEPMAWTVDTLDWTEPGVGTIVRRVREGRPRCRRAVARRRGRPFAERDRTAPVPARTARRRLPDHRAPASLSTTGPGGPVRRPGGSRPGPGR